MASLFCVSMKLNPNPKGGRKSLSNHPSTTMGVKKIINWAHRGASGHVTENTLLAFQQAVEMGADGIECDIRETRDGQLVIFHDATLKRMANRSRAIEKSTRAQLQQIHICTETDTECHKERIPELSQLFKTIKAPCQLNLEIKKAEPTKLLNQVYQHHAQKQVLLSSFEGALLSKIRSLDSEIAIGYLLDKGVTTATVKKAKEISVRSLHLNIKKITKKVIERVHGEGFQVYAYTVDDLASMAQLIDMGVDGLFTNYPDRLSQLLSGYPPLERKRGIGEL